MFVLNNGDLSSVIVQKVPLTFSTNICLKQNVVNKCLSRFLFCGLAVLCRRTSCLVVDHLIALGYEHLVVWSSYEELVFTVVADASVQS